MADTRDREQKPRCRDVEPLFAPYADGDRSVGDAAAVEAHVGRCPPCRQQVNEQRAVREALHARRDELRVSAPDSLRARCEAQGRRAALLSRRTLVPLSLAASLLLALGGVFLFGVGDRGAALAAQINRDHVRCFEARPQQGVRLDADAVSRQWAQTHGWTLRVPPADAATAVDLVAVRRCLSADGGSAHILYTWHGEPLSLYVLPRSVDEDARRTLLQKFGGRAVAWVRDGRTYVMVHSPGAPDRPDLERVTEYMRTRAE